MMLANEELRTVLVTIHMALRDALDALSEDGILETIAITDRALRAAGIGAPRIAVAGVNPHGGIQLDQYAAIVRAVAAGLGVGLVPTCLIEDELARGEVVEPLAAGVGRFEADAGYVLCYPEHKASLPALLAFRGWLREAAGAAAPRRPS